MFGIGFRQSHCCNAISYVRQLFYVRRLGCDTIDLVQSSSGLNQMRDSIIVQVQAVSGYVSGEQKSRSAKNGNTLSRGGLLRHPRSKSLRIMERLGRKRNMNEDSQSQLIHDLPQAKIPVNKARSKHCFIISLSPRAESLSHTRVLVLAPRTIHLPLTPLIQLISQTMVAESLLMNLHHVLTLL